MISDSKIEPRPSVKVLGVLLDQQLSWEPHISMVVRRCNSIIASLYKVRHHFTMEVLKLLVQLHVFPHILYCLSVWGGAAQCRLHRVQKALNFGARLVTGLRRSDHITPTLTSLGWAKIETMVIEHDCTQVFKAMNIELSPEAIRCMFVTRAERSTMATSAGKLHLQKCDLTVTKRSFAYRAANAWNSLPPETRHSSTRSAFVKALERGRPT